MRLGRFAVPVALAVLLGGCGGGGAGAASPPIPVQPGRIDASGPSNVLTPLVPAAGPRSLYVLVQSTSGEALEEFATTANGGEAPLRTLTGFGTAGGFAVAIDGTIAVWEQPAPSGGRFAFFAPGAAGNAIPSRTLQAPPNARALAFDRFGRLYVQTATGAVIYASSASGTDAPVGTATEEPQDGTGIAVAPDGSFALGISRYFYPASPAGIAAFAALPADGGSAVRAAESVFAGSAGVANAVATNGLDDAVAFGRGPINSRVFLNGGVVVARAATLAEERIITSGGLTSPDTGLPVSYPNVTTLNVPGGVAIDADGTVYVADRGTGCSAQGHIAVFAPNADGNVAPIRTIFGGASGIVNPVAVALGPR